MSPANYYVFTFGRGFPFLRPPRRDRPRGTVRTGEASENERKEVWDSELIDNTIGAEQRLFHGKIKRHASRDKGIDCTLDPNTILEGESKRDVTAVNGVIGTNRKECFHVLSSRVELEGLRKGFPRFFVKHDKLRDLITDSTFTVSWWTPCRKSFCE